MPPTNRRLNKGSIFAHYLTACVKANSFSLFSLPDKFIADPDDADLMDFVRSYYGKFSKLPSLNTVWQHLGYRIRPSEPPEFYEQQLSELWAKAKLAEEIPSIARIISDPDKAVAKLGELYDSLSQESSLNIAVTGYLDGLQGRIDTYKLREQNNGVLYLSTGFDYLDNVFYGYYPTDLITMGGRGGVGKTWYILDLILAMDEWLEDLEAGNADKPPLFKDSHVNRPLILITNEISEVDMSERLDCLKLRLPYEKFLRGELEPYQKKKYESYSGASRIKIIRSVKDVDEIKRLIHIYRPLAIFLDGSYLLYPDWEEGVSKTTFITRNLKSIALDYEVPIINTTQLRKKAGKADMSYLDAQEQFFYGSYTHDSDIALYGYQTPDMIFRQEIGLIVAKGRKVKAGTKLLWQRPLHTMAFRYLDPEPDIDFDDNGSFI